MLCANIANVSPTEYTFVFQEFASRSLINGPIPAWHTGEIVKVAGHLFWINSVRAHKNLYNHSPHLLAAPKSPL